MPKKPTQRRVPQHSETGSRAGVVPFLILLGAAFLACGNTLLNGFVHDDKPLVAENRLIRDVANLPRILTSGYWTTRDASVPELYRPVTVATFALNHLLGGPAPFGFHLVNLLLHAWVSWLVYRLAREITGSPSGAWAAGLLFAVHPVHSEAVAEVVGRSDLLAAGFALAALLLHRRSGASAAPSRLALAAAACYLLAALSKENALILPALFLVTDLSSPPRSSPTGEKGRRAVAYSLYLISAVVYLILRVSVLGSVARSDIRPLDNPLVDAGPLAGRLTAVITAGKYLGLLVWPAHLSADYSRDQIPLWSRWSDPRLAGSLLALLAAGVLAAWGWRRWRAASASVFFYGAAILPVSNLLFPIGTIFGERLLYLPSAGFCILAGALFALLWKKSRRLAAALAGILLVAGIARSADRNRIWHDDATFAFATARDAPRSAKAQFNLGVFLEEHADLRGAAKAYALAGSLDPGWGDPHFNLGGVLLRLDSPAEAVKELRRAVELSPGQPRTRVNLGVALNRAGRYQEAADLYREMIREGPPSAEAWNNLGVNLMALERFADAAGAFRQALTLDPASVSYHANLGQAAEASGDLATAEAEYRAALGASGDSPPLLRALGLLLARRGNRQEAASLLRRAESLLPGGLDPEARAVLQSLP